MSAFRSRKNQEVKREKVTGEEKRKNVLELNGKAKMWHQKRHTHTFTFTFSNLAIKQLWFTVSLFREKLSDILIGQ